MKRIVSRPGDPPDNLERRIDAAVQQLDYAWSYDYILVNDHLREFLRDVESVFAQTSSTGREGCDQTNLH